MLVVEEIDEIDESIFGACAGADGGGIEESHAEGRGDESVSQSGDDAVVITRGMQGIGAVGGEELCALLVEDDGEIGGGLRDV